MQLVYTERDGYVDFYVNSRAAVKTQQTAAELLKRREFLICFGLLLLLQFESAFHELSSCQWSLECRG